jgi:uncharacterized membrane protein
MAQDTFTHAYERTFGGGPNLSRGEGAASVVFGILLAAGAVRRPDWRGLLMGLGGSALVARGLSRHGPLKAALQGQAQGRMAAAARARQMRYADAI